MPLREINHEVQAADRGRVDLLVARLTQFSRARVRGLIDHGGVRLNESLCDDSGTALQVGDRIALRFDPQHNYREKPKPRVSKARGFTVVYKDDDLVVVNKEAGILTVPTERRESNSLVDLLASHIFGPGGRGIVNSASSQGASQGRGDAASQGRSNAASHGRGFGSSSRRTSPGHISIVHRLDRETSGLLVFGLNADTARAIISQFSERKPEREYFAIVAGRLDEDKGEIRSFLKSDKALNQRSSDSGEEAITHFKVIERLRGATLIRVRLETGRRNQIRVHFAEKGHPVLGDTRYEAELARHREWPYKRLALHARVLGFKHPVDGRSLRFEQELPVEFQGFLRSHANQSPARAAAQGPARAAAKGPARAAAQGPARAAAKGPARAAAPSKTRTATAKRKG